MAAHPAFAGLAWRVLCDSGHSRPGHRLSTGEVNQVLQDAYNAIQVPTRQGRPLRIYYGTQVGNDPPTFVTFVNDEVIDVGYFPASDEALTVAQQNWLTAMGQ